MKVSKGLGKTYPVPKPSDGKKKKKTNGWKDKPKRFCYYCGTPYAERHEVYGGPNRQISIDLGFQLDLCQDCHRKWHEQNDETWIRRKAYWQRKMQKDYESKLIEDGMPAEAVRRHWMAIIGKSYE